jgi:hypothetical protein
MSEVYDEQVVAYLETGLFTAIGENGVPLDLFYTVEDFTPEAFAKAKQELGAFFSECDRALKPLGLSIESGWTELDRFAQDFWYDRNGHGVGFLDRPNIFGVFADLFSELAKTFPEQWVYEKDNGRLGLEP